MTALNVEARRQKERPMWRSALLASVLLHMLFFFLGGTVRIPDSPFAAAGPREGDSRAAKGGMQALQVVAPQPRPVIPPPIPIEVAIEVEPLPLEIAPDPSFDLASTLGLDPGFGPPGHEDGEGEGDGGTLEGILRVIPPIPRSVILPPPDKPKGAEVTTWVFVDERGRVIPDSTRLDPPTRDRGYNRQLIRDAADWMFWPGKNLEGQPVAAWFPITLR